MGKDGIKELTGKIKLIITVLRVSDNTVVKVIPFLIGNTKFHTIIA